jgi:predicted transcriptional regulator
MNRYRYIKSLLVRQGISNKELAEELFVSRQAVSAVIQGKDTSRRIQEHIAKRLKRDFAKLWDKAA